MHDLIPYIQGLSGADALGFAFLFQSVVFVSYFLVDFALSISRACWDVFRAKHCSDLHAHASLGDCHYKGCPHSESCPYFVDNSLKVRFQVWCYKRQLKKKNRL